MIFLFCDSRSLSRHLVLVITLGHRHTSWSQTVCHPRVTEGRWTVRVVGLRGWRCVCPRKPLFRYRSFRLNTTPSPSIKISQNGSPSVTTLGGGGRPWTLPPLTSGRVPDKDRVVGSLTRTVSYQITFHRVILGIFSHFSLPLPQVVAVTVPS